MTDSGNVTPTSEFDRRAEVSALLATDETWLGDIYRSYSEGKTAIQIAEEFSVTPSPVYSYFRTIEALLDGTSTAPPTVASGWAGRIRGWLKNKPLSPELREALTRQEQLLSEASSDPAATKAESEEAVTKSKAAEAENVPGVYVYTLPHYVRYPFDPKTGRTLLKVGHSSTSAHFRASAQARSTELPEDPWLLRIYPAESSAEAEKKFHAFLKAADHNGVKGNRTGAEWFLTSLKFLDHIAKSLDLTSIVVNDFEIPEDE